MRIANLRKIFSSCSSISCWVSQGVQGVTMIKAEDIFPELWLDFGQGLWGQLHCNDNEVPYAIVRQVAIHSVSGGGGGSHAKFCNYCDDEGRRVPSRLSLLLSLVSCKNAANAEMPGLHFVTALIFPLCR